MLAGVNLLGRKKGNPPADGTDAPADGESVVKEPGTNTAPKGRPTPKRDSNRRRGPVAPAPMTTAEAVGQVFLGGELWSAKLGNGDGPGRPVAIGSRVRVESVEGLTLEVSPLDGNEANVGAAAEENADEGVS